MQVLYAFLILLSAGFARTAGAETAPCALAVPPVESAMRLPHAAVGRLDILALGSGSMLGPEGSVAHSLANEVAERLRTALPGRDIAVRVVGRRGQTAVEMLAALRSALARGRTALVLWQTGTVEAIHRLPVQGFKATLSEGLGVIRAAGADAILVDPQYSRRLAERVDVQAFRTALQEVARENGVAVFDRFGLMRGWTEAGLDLDHTRRADRKAVAARVQSCLAEALAGTVLAGLKP